MRNLVAALLTALVLVAFALWPGHVMVGAIFVVVGLLVFTLFHALLEGIR